jgi:hypothetical protein
MVTGDMFAWKIHQVFINLGLLGIFAAPYILLYQAYQWYRAGQWHDITLASFLNYFYIPYLSTRSEWIQAVFNYLIGCPLSGCFLTTGLGFVLVGMQLEKLHEE